MNCCMLCALQLCGMSLWRSLHKCQACGMCEEEPFLPLADTLWHFFKEQMLIYG